MSPHKFSSNELKINFYAKMQQFQVIGYVIMTICVEKKAVEVSTE